MTRWHALFPWRCNLNFNCDLILRIFLQCQQPYHVRNFDFRLSAFDFVRICGKHDPVVGFFESTVQAREDHKSRKENKDS